MKTLAIFSAALAIAFLAALVLSIPTMLLWDWLMPDIFGLKEITLFQSLGLNMLTAILFKTTITIKND
jgi:hypothetical protein